MNDPISHVLRESVVAVAADAVEAHYNINGGITKIRHCHPTLYPLATHFADEQARWLNGGEMPEVINRTTNV